MNQPNEIALNYINVAKSKTSQMWYKTLLLAVLAGAFIALGAVLATVAGAGFSGSQAALIKGAVFPLGLILVTVCGAELFTGNCLLIAPLINRDIKITGMLKNWGIAYGGNLIGSVLIAVLAVFGHVFGTKGGDGVAQAVNACINTAAAKSTMAFSDAFVRGILCNMLVCLAVWAAMASKNIGGKILAVYMPVFAFVVCGFEHSVANMYYLTAGLMAGAEYSITVAGLTLGNALLYCLLPSTLGNIIGGGLIAVTYKFVYLKRNKPVLQDVSNEK